MKTSFYPYLNALAHLALVMLLAGMQTTLWYQVFTLSHPPILWLIWLVFIALYRKPFEALTILYVGGVVLSTYTIKPLGLLWLHILFLYVFIYLLKQRIFLHGSKYFLIVVCVVSVFYNISDVAISWFIEKQPILSVDLLGRCFQIIVTPLFAVPLFKIMLWLDRLTAHEFGSDPGEASL